jgi:hypothetical protein
LSQGCLQRPIQRLREVRQQIAPVFDANRYPNQAVGHSGFGELLFSES